jgi:hypothetical protein
MVTPSNQSRRFRDARDDALIYITRAPPDERAIA